MDNTHKIPDLRKNKRRECVCDLASWHGGKFRALESYKLGSASRGCLQSAVWYWAAHPSPQHLSFPVYQVELAAGGSKEYVSQSMWNTVSGAKSGLNKLVFTVHEMARIPASTLTFPPSWSTSLTHSRHTLHHLTRRGTALPLSNLCLSPLGPQLLLLSGTFSRYFSEHLKIRLHSNTPSPGFWNIPLYHHHCLASGSIFWPRATSLARLLMLRGLPVTGNLHLHLGTAI